MRSFPQLAVRPGGLGAQLDLLERRLAVAGLQLGLVDDRARGQGAGGAVAAVVVAVVVVALVVAAAVIVALVVAMVAVAVVGRGGPVVALDLGVLRHVAREGA